MKKGPFLVPKIGKQKQIPNAMPRPKRKTGKRVSVGPKGLLELATEGAEYIVLAIGYDREDEGADTRVRVLKDYFADRGYSVAVSHLEDNIYSLSIRRDQEETKYREDAA